VLCGVTPRGSMREDTPTRRSEAGRCMYNRLVHH
jgi:hypothetical protein